MSPLSGYWFSNQVVLFFSIFLPVLSLTAYCHPNSLFHNFVSLFNPVADQSRIFPGFLTTLFPVYTKHLHSIVQMLNQCFVLAGLGHGDSTISMLGTNPGYFLDLWWPSLANPGYFRVWLREIIMSSWINLVSKIVNCKVQSCGGCDVNLFL